MASKKTAAADTLAVLGDLAAKAPKRKKTAPPVAAAPTPPPAKKGKGKATVAVAANTATASPPKKGKARQEEAPPPAPAKKRGRPDKATTQVEAPTPTKGKKGTPPPAPALPLREVRWTDERVHVIRVMRKMKATTPARARTAEDIAIEAEVTPFRVKEMGYRGNSTRGQIGTDASPFVTNGLIAHAEPGQVAPEYLAGRGRCLAYYLTPAGCAVVLPGDKPARAAKK